MVFRIESCWQELQDLRFVLVFDFQKNSREMSEKCRFLFGTTPNRK